MLQEPQTPSAVGWRPESPAPSESALSADIGPVGPRTLSLQSSPSGSHMVDAAGLTPMTPRSTGEVFRGAESAVQMLSERRLQTPSLPDQFSMFSQLNRSRTLRLSLLNQSGSELTSWQMCAP